MATQCGECAVNLLGQHGPGEFVRKGHGRERKKQIGSGFPLRRQAVVSAQKEKQVLRFIFGAFYKLDKGRRILIATGGIKENFSGCWVAFKQVEPGGDNLAHFACRIARGALDELAGDGI